MPDVDAITTYFFCSGAYDTYEDADVQAWLKESDSTMDAEACKSAYAKAMGKIAGRAYWVPLFTWPTNYATTKDLDWPPTADEIPRFFTASWK